MAALPWTQRVATHPDGAYLLSASPPQPATNATLPPILRNTWRISRQLATTVGLAGSYLPADLLQNWTPLDLAGRRQPKSVL
jgi:hypothetical protein